MNFSVFKDIMCPLLKKWWFSLLLLWPAWMITEQYWLALARNILMAYKYEYPGLLWPLFFALDNLSLILHEGGHTIFGLFGSRFLAILGGSLMQLLIPFLVLISAWWKQQKIGAQASLFWLAYAWMDSAAYCADAKYQDLPLIGNLPKSAHDFTNLLNMTSLLEHYRTIAWIMYAIGFLALLGALLWPLFQKKETESVHLGNQLQKAGLN